MLKLSVNQMKSSLKTIFACLLVLSVASGAPLFAANTSIFFKGGILSLDQPEVEINRIYGLKLHPMNVTVRSGDKNVFFPHTIENLSNTTSKLKIEIIYVSQAKGWSAQLLRDENNDGVHQDWENKALEPVQYLGEGAVLHFFVKLTKPDDTKPGDAGSSIVKVSGSARDGDGYVGYNGVYYGGPDDEETTNTVIVK